jgi:DNA-binding CsgD family transcriptional regulator
MSPKRPAKHVSAVVADRGRRSFEQYSQLYPSLPGRIDDVITSEIPFVRERLVLLRAFLARQSGERHDWFARKYSLTPMQAKIALFIAEGGSVAQFAKAHRKSQETVRTHLKAVFRKTGVSRQSDLSRLILQPRRVFGYSFNGNPADHSCSSSDDNA